MRDYDFRLNRRQRDLQLQFRKFAQEVLAGATKAEVLLTAASGNATTVCKRSLSDQTAEAA